MTRTLAFFLKPGGCLLVADKQKMENDEKFLPDDPHHMVAHSGGISEGDLRKAFEGAGLESFHSEYATSLKMGGVDVDYFLAKGVKPVAQ